jgi:hypothetical protein
VYIWLQLHERTPISREDELTLHEAEVVDVIIFLQIHNQIKYEYVHYVTVLSPSLCVGGLHEGVAVQVSDCYFPLTT